MSKQAASKIMMVRPKHFGYDPASAATNAFQNSEGAENTNEIQSLALKEFDNAVAILRNENVEVVVVEDTDKPRKPNAIFPNNWVSFHRNTKAVMYPMMAENRRWERRTTVIDQVQESGVGVDEIIDLTAYENEEKYLESTGSLILDYVNEIAFACISERTNREVIQKFAEIMDIELVLFDAVDRSGLAIYHTNVMLCIGASYAILCVESIPEDQRSDVISALEKTGHEVIAITYDQMYAFAGNMLEVENESGQSILVMSESAMKSLDLDQKERISKYSKMINIPIPTIEKYGGGSIRCMMCRVL